MSTFWSALTLDIEHIVIDGASVDNTTDIIKNYNNLISKWISEEDKGIYDAMNKGLSIASGDVVGFLNADDIFFDNHVLEKVASVFSDPSVDCCYGDLVYVDLQNMERVVRYWKSCEYRYGLFGRGWCPPHPTFYARKKVFEKYGGFDLGYEMGNDVELMMRFLAHYKIKVKYIPEILIRMRMGGESNKNIFNIIKQNFEIIRAIKKNNLRVSLFMFSTCKLFSRLRQFYNSPKKTEAIDE